MWTRDLFDSPAPGTSSPPARRGTSRRRPTRRRLEVEALDPRIVPASLMMSDATLVEGNAGTHYAVVRVSLDVPSPHAVTVNYSTADGTAVAGGDYQAASGRLSFARGETSKSILVAVIGDRLAESDETFVVKLGGATGAKIADGLGVVTIRDDEPRISISDASAPEGNSGSTPFTFTVSLSAAYDQAVTVNYATADSTATTAHNDYVATSGTLTFAPGETSKTITVQVIGNITPEQSKTFFVNLSAALDQRAPRPVPGLRDRPRRRHARADRGRPVFRDRGPGCRRLRVRQLLRLAARSMDLGQRPYAQAEGSGMAVATWLAYLCVHFVLVPGWFAWRYRRPPYALQWLPRNVYDLGESAYGLLVAGYTIAVLLGPRTEPRWTLLAVACVMAGSGLIVWAVATLGASWRIGQDVGDTTCVYVACGPYRLLRHPIYLGMIISALGQMLLTAADMRGLILLVGTVAYALFQGRAESRRWGNPIDDERSCP